MVLVVLVDLQVLDMGTVVELVKFFREFLHLFLVVQVLLVHLQVRHLCPVFLVVHLVPVVPVDMCSTELQLVELLS